MFSIFDKNKNKKQDMNDLGTFLPDESDEPNNQPKSTEQKPKESQKIKMFGDIPRKKEKTSEVKKQEKTNLNAIFADSDNIFKKEEKKEEKKIIGLFADIGSISQEKKVEVKNHPPKISMFDMGNQNNKEENNIQKYPEKKDNLHPSIVSENKENISYIKKENNDKEKGKEVQTKKEENTGNDNNLKPQDKIENKIENDENKKIEEKNKEEKKIETFNKMENKITEKKDDLTNKENKPEEIQNKEVSNNISENKVNEESQKKEDKEIPKEDIIVKNIENVKERTNEDKSEKKKRRKSQIKM
jgi:hypothetical protein